MPGPSTNAPLFPKKAMDALIEADRWPLTDSDQLRAIAARWRDDLAAGRIRKSDETALYRQFINQFFVQTLGYRGFSEVDPGQSFTLKEVTGLGTGTGSIPDLSLGLFDPAASTEPPLVPVELKSANTPLERSYAGRDSAIHQMLRYLVQSRGDWAAASNIGEFRLYHRLAGLNRFQGWTLDELAGGPHRPRLEFHACLAAKNLVVRDGAGLTVLDRAFAAIGELQEKVSKEFYRDYKALRREMFDALRLLNPDYPPDKLLSKAQMLLDRLLFICFAEDRGLLPPNILAARLTGDLPPGRNPKTRNLQELFQGINEGWDHFKIPRYNGGLFRPDEDLDRMLQLDDRVADWALQLAKRDFYEEVSVDVLGHIFEQSITDLEELRAEVAGQQSDKRNSKRKREGVFYTPRYVTEYIVRHTVGTKVDELLKASEALYAPKISRARSDRARDAARAKQLEHFRNGVGSLRVVDPACGSGAFLLAAFEYLRRIYGDTQAEINRLLRDDLPFDPDDTILQRNLYGVDLNSESVEITKLSLWIATAKHGRLLTNLDDTIRMGNSLVDDHDIDPRAFDWQKSFPEVFEDGGFDCVIGNPPYVRQERIKHLKPYLAQKYECYDAAADLYTYFYELGLRILKQGGRLGFITSGQFFRSAYGKPLRGLLAERSRLDQVLHFGDYRVFKDALVRSPSILVVGRDQSADQVRVWINTSKTRLPDLLQENFLNQLGYSSPAADFGTGAWSFLSEDHRNVSKTLLARGTSLEETGHQRIYRGVVTGLNSTKGSNGLGVFVVDAIKRAELIGRDPKSAEIL
ncbi:MAG TPA: DNA methyltransferase, partial [bacterium]|nr:DNA methyltransferase [bacterium]